MKIERVVRRGLNEEKGAILLIVIVFMIVLTITGLALLHATVLEHNLAMREVYKNQAFYLADGGIEHLSCKLYSFGGQQAIREMVPVSGGYDGEYRPAIGVTSSGEGDYWVEYYEGSSAYAISTGQITKGDRQILRRIKVEIYESGLFDYGIFGDKGIRMTGVGEDQYKVSSWRSTDKVYDPPGGEGKTKIGTNASGPKALDLQNSQVNGSAYVGPGANLDEAISLGQHGFITGEQTWLSSPRQMDVFVPDGVESLVPGVPNPLEVGTEEIWTISDDGYYSSINVHGTLIIDADCLLKVDTLTIQAQGSIVVTSTAYVTLYITQEMSSKGGGFVNESEVPSQLRIYGGPDCTAIEIGGTPDFYGVVYAPTANIDCNGTGDIYGSLVGDFVRVVGTPHVYYDVALQDDPSVLVLTYLGNWEEIF